MTETPKFSIHYKKDKMLDLESLEKSFIPSNEDSEQNYNPYKILGLQKYNPIYKEFFDLNENNYNGISLNHKYALKTHNSVIDVETKEVFQKPTFIKYSPLLDPLRYMTGKYKTEISNINMLPKLDKNAHPKILDSNNSAYTDNFFCYLSSNCLNTHGFLHGLEYYGSYLGIQEKHKMNVSDDLEYLSGSTYFNKNINVLFMLSETEEDEFLNFGSRNNKMKLRISNTEQHNITAISVEDLTVGDKTDETANELVYEKPNDGTNSNSSSSESDSDSNSDSNSDSDSDSESDSESENSGLNNEESDNNSENGGSNWETENSDDAYEEEVNKFAYIKDFPVQLICIEKCDGTMDELFEKNKLGEKEASAALLQVIMSLLAYQKMFHFTHNDLHTNNIMYINTEIEYLFYKFKNVVYKVPTYGKIYKIIDFGRSIYRFNGKIFCSDSFAPGGDASTQYNCEPFINEKKARIDPNYSFDLCRLGCSLYDFVIDEDDNPKNYNDLQKTVNRWCTDDLGRNVLYKKNGDERFPGFKLYKMIARLVHHHTPEQQLEYEYFNKYVVSTKDAGLVIIDIDKMPVYV